MKKLFKKGTAILLSVIMLTSLMITGVFAATSEDGYWSYTILDEDAKTASVTGYEGEETALVIPREIDGYSITSIGSDTFRYSSIVSVEIPDTVTSIGSCAFIGSESLTSIYIPSSVTSIDSWAFYTYSNSSTITYDGTFEEFCEIENISFDCLESGTILKTTDENVTINDYTFTGYEYIEVDGIEGGKIYFDADTGTIINADYTITSADIPETINGVAVTAIDWYAFGNCQELTSVTIPANVTDIDSSAFKFCSNLAEFIVDSDNESYASVDGILYDKAKTKIIVIPLRISGDVEICDGIETIEWQAFSDCTSLESITLPKSVTEIVYSAFNNCTSLESIVISDSIEAIGKTAFEYCDSLETIYYTGTETQWNSIDLDNNWNAIGDDWDTGDYIYGSFEIIYNYGVDTDVDTDDTTTDTSTDTDTDTTTDDTTVDTTTDDTESTVTIENTSSVEVALNKDVESVFTAEELADDEELKVELTVSEVTEFTTDEQTAIDELEETYEVALILDIDLTKYVGDTATSLTDLDEEIEITIDIPEELQGKDLVIIRIHENEDGTITTDILTDTDDDDETFTFKTKKFSTYALAEVVTSDDETEGGTTEDTTTDDETEDETTEDEETEVPETGDTSDGALLAVIMFVSLLGIICVSKKKLSK
ncbi:MAG: leucine-rich repeat domain-containing protein [Clostridia bacterium]